LSPRGERRGHRHRGTAVQPASAGRAKRTQGIQALAGKLKTAADGGSADAREWLLDLKELALNIQTEQQQVMVLM